MSEDLSIICGEDKLNVRVIFLTENNNRYLIESTSVENHYNIPGGRMKFRETSYQTALREIKEELGIEVNEEDIKMIATLENLFNFDGKNYHEFNYVFHLKLKDDYDICKVDEFYNKDKETQIFKWVKKEDIDQYKFLAPYFHDLDPNQYKHIIINNNQKKVLVH